MFRQESSNKTTRWIIFGLILIVLVGLSISFLSLSSFVSTRANKADNPVVSGVNEAIPPSTPIPTVNLAEQTNRLLGLMRAYNNASDQAREQALSALVEQAQSRQDAFASAIRENPEEAIRAAIPTTVYNGLPPQVQAFIEQEETIEGEYLILHSDDFERETSSSSHRLLKDDGTEVELFPTVEHNMPNPGGRIRLQAYQLEEVAVTDTDSEDTVEEITPATSIEAAPAPRQALIVLFNFQNNSTSQPFSPDTARNYVFGENQSLKDYYEETSFNKITFTGKLRPDGDVTDWLTIPYDNTQCGSNYYTTWTTAARTAAEQAGWDLTGYDHIIFSFPAADCSFGGAAYTGGNYVWIPSQYLGYSYPVHTIVVSHEVGHNLGYRHANTYECTDNGQRVAISNSCTSNPYRDPFDIMGSSTNKSPFHMTSFRKRHTGFIESVNMQDVTSSGTYTIAPIEQSSTTVQSLRIQRDSSNYFYLDFRQPFGYDNFNASDPSVNGVSIRLGPNYTSYAETQLIDTTANTSSYNDAALAAGQTFTDPVTGITVTTQSVSPTGAIVDVSFNCIQVDPTVTLSPTAQWGSAGQSLSYDLTVTNNDGSGCPASSFSINPTLPSGWSQTGPTQVETLGPGTSSTQAITVTSDTTTSEGLYEFTETVTSTTVPNIGASVTGSYNVAPPDTTAPVVTITEPVDGEALSGNRTKISVDASDTSGVASITIAVNGEVINTCTGTTTCNTNWSTRGLADGNYTITTTAQDTVTPTPNVGSTSVTVTIGGSSGGGGNDGGGQGGGKDNPNKGPKK